MSYRNFSPEDICRKLDIPALNPMQEKMITASREEDRLMLLSATGSGKTLAFLLPILDQMDPEQKGTQAMVIAPSRELAMQIGKVFQSLGSGFKLTLCYGGHAREIEENSLTDAPALIIGTPGRLADHLRRQNITADTIKMLVLDEFDKTLELGFQDEVYQIISALPAVEKKLLVSATRGAELPEGLEVDDPVVVDFLPETEEPETSRLALQQVLSPEKDKSDTLFRLVCALGARPMIVFCNHREAVERTGELLKEKGISCVYYHGAMEQRDRDIALCKFRNGSVYILVTTDIAARGLDVPHIRYIIHYHLPHTEDIFTHRNGRTARMEASGTGIVILGPEEELPEYMDPETEIRELPDEAILPEKPKWTTLFVAAGKKNKVNKTDILGFLAQKGELKREDIGLIEVGDFNSYVAVRKSKVSHALQQIRDHRLKNKNVRIEVAK